MYLALKNIVFYIFYSQRNLPPTYFLYLNEFFASIGNKHQFFTLKEAQ